MTLMQPLVIPSNSKSASKSKSKVDLHKATTSQQSVSIYSHSPAHPYS